MPIFDLSYWENFKSEFGKNAGGHGKIKVATKLEGVDATVRFITTYKKELLKKFPRAVDDAAQVLLEKSRYYCPIDRKKMYNISRVETVGFGNKAESDVIYDTKYAVFVHEDQEAAHGEEYNIKHAEEIAAGKDHLRRPQECYKFLEKPAREIETQEAMRQKIHQRLGR